VNISEHLKVLVIVLPPSVAISKDINSFEPLLENWAEVMTGAMRWITGELDTTRVLFFA